MTAPLISTTDRPYQLLPPLDEQQRHILRQSIQKNGVLEPVVFDEDGEILDGHHRVEIAEELGIDYPRRVIEDLDRPGKHMYALTVNVARRQLDQSARTGLVAQMRLRGMSIREIAKATGLPKTTVARDLAEVSQVGHLPETVTGADNKTYASTRPKTPGPADTTTPPVDPGATPTAAPLREPDSAEILRILGEVDDYGLTAAEIGRELVAEVFHADLISALEQLLEAGRVVVAGRTTSGARCWAMTPEPAGVPSTAPTGSGPVEAVASTREGGDATAPPVTPPPGSPATWTAEQREANQREIDRKRMVAAGQRAARNLVMSVQAEIGTVVSAIDLGEKNLINVEMIAKLRRAVDLLESRLEASR